MYWHASGLIGWEYSFVAVSVVMVFCVITAGVVALARHAGQRRDAAPASSMPGQLLARRSVRGEIGEDGNRQLGTLRGGDEQLAVKH